uniref:PWWP domain-containing protein n=1 Tax=Aegilops tauschii subsp. strangulata TaxID=200361 RepID=A0A452XSY5_AEGTS
LPLDPTPSLLQKPQPLGLSSFLRRPLCSNTHSMFSSLAPAAAASKNADGDEGRRSGPASPERLRHMHADVAELLRANTTPRRRRPKKPVPAAPAEERRHARYGCAFEEEALAEGGFAPPRMVWAKVKGYPRWPGQVFDPADASKQALRERKRGPDGAALVACFGDGSFVWAGAADLTPLRHDFPRLAAVGLRSSHKAEFALALDDALAEV